MARKSAWPLLLTTIMLLALAGSALASPVDEIRTRVDSVQGRIADAIKSGELSASSARELNFRLESIRRRVQAIAQTPAIRTEYREIMGRIDTIEGNLPKALTQGRSQAESKIEQLIGAVDYAIEQSISAHVLIALEARGLRSELAAVKREFEQALLRGPLGKNDERRLMLKLDHLAQRLEKYRTKKLHNEKGK